jgi:phage major head subunit gpT-like protein
MVSRGGFGDLLEPGLRRIFDQGASRPAPMLEALFGMQPSTKFEEHYTSIGDLALVPVWDGQVRYDNFDQGYRTDIRNYTLTKGIQVPRELIDDDQYGEIERRASALGEIFARTKEADAAQVFINAFTDSGTNRLGASTNGADSVALCSTAHPLSPVNSTTQSNEGTRALTLANWDLTVQDMQNLTDDRSELLDINPDLVLIPRELKRDAAAIFDPRAVWEPGSAEFTANIFNGQVRVVVWNRLTDANAWFAIDTRAMKEHLIWQNRIMPEFNEAADSDFQVKKWTGYMRYGIGWDDYKWINGQNPS